METHPVDSAEERKRALAAKCRAVGSVGTCSQCGAEKVPVVVFRNVLEEWCLDCREKAIAERIELDPVEKKKPEILLKYEGQTYSFRSKRAARKTMRSLLRTKQLPPEIVDQIRAARPPGRRARAKANSEESMSEEKTLTKAQLDAVVKELQNGGTMIAQAKASGVKYRRFRRQLIDHLGGEAAYQELVPPRGGGGGGTKKPKAKKAKAKAKAAASAS